jgi:hypothetical protein
VYGIRFAAAVSGLRATDERSEYAEEFLGSDTGLPQDTPERAYGNHAERRDDTADRALKRRLLHSNVTSTLTHAGKPRSFQRFDRLLAGNPS